MEVHVEDLVFDIMPYYTIRHIILLPADSAFLHRVTQEPLNLRKVFGLPAFYLNEDNLIYPPLVHPFKHEEINRLPYKAAFIRVEREIWKKGRKLL